MKAITNLDCHEIAPLSNNNKEKYLLITDIRRPTRRDAWAITTLMFSFVNVIFARALLLHVARKRVSSLFA